MSTLKRKSDTNAASDEDGPSPPRLQPVREHASALPVNPSEAGIAINILSDQVCEHLVHTSLWNTLNTPLFSSPFAKDFGAPPPVSSSPTTVLSVSRGVSQSEKAPPPQAVVKPSVLTHLIEGFVIQEGAEPFPVSTWDVWIILFKHAPCVTHM